MILPNFAKLSADEKSIVPIGIDSAKDSMDCLLESVNLEYDDLCTTRNPRKLCLPFEESPDQIIKCDDRVFLRYGNSVRELCENNGELISAEEIPLSEIEGSVDRTFIQYGNYIYVFPDEIYLTFEKEEWEDFASSDPVSVKFPFSGGNGLCYTAEHSGSYVCGDAYSLNVGTRIRFSWAGDQIFNVIKIEEITQGINQEPSLLGRMVWLDRAVPNTNSIPETATAQILYPANRPIVTPYYIGYGDRGGELSDNTVYAENYDGSNTYNDPFTKYFEVGQKVKISGAQNAENNIIATVKAVFDTQITLDAEFTKEIITSDTVVTLRPLLPQVDFCQVFDDRVFVADNKERILRCSKYGEPMKFYGNETDETKSWSYDLEQDCTGLIVFKGQLFCFEKTGGFKLYGTDGTNFSAVMVPVSGIKKGQEKSLCSVRGSALYISDFGIMQYSGTVDSKINFKTKIDSPASAVAHGARYYLLSKSKIYVYSLENKRWWCEDGTDITDIFLFKGEMYYAKNEGIYTAADGNIPVNWSFKTRLLPQSAGRVQPVSLRADIVSKNGCEISIYQRRRGSDGYTLLSRHFTQDERTLTVPMQKIWCDGFYLKFCGKGDITVEKINIIYREKQI